MATENALWKSLRRGMQGRWVVQRFEDKLSLGIPDLGYVTNIMDRWGWLELKRVPAFPVRPTTPVRIPHPKHWKIQQAWARRYGKRTGMVFLLLQVAREFFLFDWQGLQDVGDMTRDELIACTNSYWRGHMDYEEFTDIISHPIFFRKPNHEVFDDTYPSAGR